MVVEVASSVIAHIGTHAQAKHPEECCGILLGGNGHIAHAMPAENVHSKPETHFEIDPQTLIDAHREARSGGPEIAGYYHSHPVGKPEPSATDAAMAAGDGRIWAIIANDQIRFWLDTPHGFEALSYQVLD